MVAHLDQSQKVTGIICDLCGIACTDKFEYYSGRFDLVEVDRSLSKSAIKQVDKRFLDIDLCSVCFTDLQRRMLEVINKRENSSWSTKTNGK